VSPTLDSCVKTGPKGQEVSPTLGSCVTTGPKGQEVSSTLDSCVKLVLRVRKCLRPLALV